MARRKTDIYTEWVWTGGGVGRGPGENGVICLLGFSNWSDGYRVCLHLSIQHPLWSLEKNMKQSVKNQQQQGPHTYSEPGSVLSQYVLFTSRCPASTPSDTAFWFCEILDTLWFDFFAFKMRMFKHLRGLFPRWSGLILLYTWSCPRVGNFLF